MLRHVHEEGNVVLHGDSEAGAVHGSIDKTSLQLQVEVDRIHAALHAAVEEAEELARGIEHGAPLADGDAAARGPGELPKRADEAFVGTLRALPGEGRLGHRLSVYAMRGGEYK